MREKRDVVHDDRSLKTSSEGAQVTVVKTDTRSLYGNDASEIEQTKARNDGKRGRVPARHAIPEGKNMTKTTPQEQIDDWKAESVSAIADQKWRRALQLCSWLR